MAMLCVLKFFSTNKTRLLYNSQTHNTHKQVNLPFLSKLKWIESYTMHEGLFAFHYFYFIVNIFSFASSWVSDWCSISRKKNESEHIKTRWYQYAEERWRGRYLKSTSRLFCKQATSECDWMVMPSLFIASQSSCFIFCSPRTNSPDGKHAGFRTRLLCCFWCSSIRSDVDCASNAF